MLMSLCLLLPLCLLDNRQEAATSPHPQQTWPESGVRNHVQFGGSGFSVEGQEGGPGGGGRRGGDRALISQRHTQGHLCDIITRRQLHYPLTCQSRRTGEFEEPTGVSGVLTSESTRIPLPHSPAETTCRFNENLVLLKEDRSVFFTCYTTLHLDQNLIQSLLSDTGKCS